MTRPKHAQRRLGWTQIAWISPLAANSLHMNASAHLAVVRHLLPRTPLPALTSPLLTIFRPAWLTSASLLQGVSLGLREGIKVSGRTGSKLDQERWGSGGWVPFRLRSASWLHLHSRRGALFLHFQHPQLEGVCLEACRAALRFARLQRALLPIRGDHARCDGMSLAPSKPPGCDGASLS